MIAASPQGLLISFFYSRVWCRLRKLRVRSSIPVSRILHYTLAINAFYFACWAPYWIGVRAAPVLCYRPFYPTSPPYSQVLYAHFSPSRLTETDNFGKNNTYVYLMYLVRGRGSLTSDPRLPFQVHALPVANSSLNWVFYAQLDAQLRRRREEAAGAVDRRSAAAVSSPVALHTRRRRRLPSSFSSPAPLAKVAV